MGRVLLVSLALAAEVPPGPEQRAAVRVQLVLPGQVAEVAEVAEVLALPERLVQVHVARLHLARVLRMQPRPDLAGVDPQLPLPGRMLAHRPNA